MRAAVFVHFLGAVAVGDAGGLHDGGVGGLPDGDKPGHGVDEGDEPVLVDLDLMARAPAHDVKGLGFEGDSVDLAGGIGHGDAHG